MNRDKENTIKGYFWTSNNRERQREGDRKKERDKEKRERGSGKKMNDRMRKERGKQIFKKKSITIIQWEKKRR